MSFVSDYTETDSIAFLISSPVTPTRPPLNNIKTISYNGKYWLAGGTDTVQSRNIFTHPDVTETLEYATRLKADLKSLTTLRATLINENPTLNSVSIRTLTSEINNKNTYYKSLVTSANSKFNSLKGLGYNSQLTTIRTLHSLMISYNGINWTLIEDNPFQFYPKINNYTNNFGFNSSNDLSSVSDIKWNSTLSLWVAVGNNGTQNKILKVNGTWGESQTPEYTLEYSTLIVPPGNSGNSPFTRASWGTPVEIPGYGTGNGFYIRSGIATSRDGLNWTQRGCPGLLDNFGSSSNIYYVAPTRFLKVACSSTLTIILGVFITTIDNVSTTEYIATSTDCITWNLQRKATSNLRIIPQSIAYNGALWVVVGQKVSGGTVSIQVSPNGTTWTSIPMATPNYSDSVVAWNGNTWMAICKDGNSADIYTSTIGYEWNRVNTITTSSNSPISIAWDGNFWLISFYQTLNNFYKTQDGIELIPLNIECDTICTNIPLPILGGTLNFPSSLIVGYGTPTSALRSSDEINWISSQFDVEGNNFLGETRKDLFGIAWCGTFWIAVGNPLNQYNGKSVVRSTDGFIWTYPSTYLERTSSAVVSKARDVIWTGSLAIIVGDSVATSTDGITWTQYNSPFPISNAIAWNGKTTKLTVTSFAASSNGRQVVTVTSTSGISIGETITIQNATDNLNNGTFLITAFDATTFTWANTLGVSKTESSTVYADSSLYVVGGEGGIAISIDANKWIKTSQCPLSTVYDIAWNGYIWIAVGVATQQPIILSIDGIRWYSANTETIVFSQCNAIAWNKNLWVAVGLGDNNTIATSVDGYNWVGRGNNAFTTSGDIVGFNGINWIAGGKGFYQLARSTDGITWTGYNAKIENCRSYANKTISLPYTGTATLAVKQLVDDGVATVTTLTNNTTTLVQSITQLYLTPQEIAALAAAEALRINTAKAVRLGTKISATKYIWQYIYWNHTIKNAYNNYRSYDLIVSAFNVDYSSISNYATIVSEIASLPEYLSTNLDKMLSLYSNILNDANDQSILDINLLSIYNIHIEYKSKLVDFYENLRAIFYVTLYGIYTSSVLNKYSSQEISLFLDAIGFTENTERTKSSALSVRALSRSLLESTYITARNFFATPITSITFTPETTTAKYTPPGGGTTIDFRVIRFNPSENDTQLITVDSSTSGITTQTFTVTSFATSSNGLQVVTVTSNSGISIGDIITIQNAQTFAGGMFDNNGSYVVTALGTNTFTWANGAGINNSAGISVTARKRGSITIENAVNSANNGTYYVFSAIGNLIRWGNSSGVATSQVIFESEFGDTNISSVLSRGSSNAPNYATNFNNFNYSSFHGTNSQIKFLYDTRINIIDKYYNDTKLRLLEWKTLNNFDSTTATVFSAPSDGIQTITVSQIENIQPNRVVTISGATNSTNNVKAALVVSVSGNTFTIENYLGIAATNQTATVNYSDSAISYTSLDADFNTLKTTSETRFDGLGDIITENRSITSNYAWGSGGYTSSGLNYFELKCKFYYDIYSNIYSYSNDLFRLTLKFKYSLNLLEFDRKDAITYAEQQLSTVRNEVKYFQLTTRQSYSEELLTMRNHYLRLLTTAVYDSSLYEKVLKLSDIIFAASRIYPTYSTEIERVKLAILYAEIDGCKPNINGWGGASSTPKIIQSQQLKIQNPIGVAATNQTAIGTYTIIPKITAFGTPSDTGFQQIFTSLFDNPITPSDISIGRPITITGASNSVNNVTNSTICGFDRNNGTVLIYNLTGVAAINQNAKGSRSFTITQFGTPTGLPIGEQTVSINDPTSLIYDISIKNKTITISGASNPVNNSTLTTNVLGFTEPTSLGQVVTLQSVVAISLLQVVYISGSSSPTNNGQHIVRSIDTNNNNITILNPNGVEESDNGLTIATIRDSFYIRDVIKEITSSVAVPGKQQGRNGWKYFNNVYYAIQAKTDYENTIGRKSGSVSIPYNLVSSEILAGDDASIVISGNSNSNNNGTFKVARTDGTHIFISNRTLVPSYSNTSIVSILFGTNNATYTTTTSHGLSVNSYVRINNDNNSVFQVSAVPSTTKFTIPRTVNWGNRLELLASAFSAPSNGIQTITFTSYNGRRPFAANRYITITGASNAANNVTNVLVISISGNTFTISNGTGVAASNQTASVNYADYDYVFDDSFNVAITSFSRPNNNNGNQIITVAAIGNIQVGRNVTITNAGRGMNSVRIRPVLSVSGNTFTIQNAQGFSSTSNFTVTHFAASSNGTQVLTVAGDYGNIYAIEIGDSVVIANAPNPANNGTYLVTAVGTNTITKTITWANPSGVASLGGIIPTATRGNVVLRVQIFAASSNGTQVLTVTSDSYGVFSTQIGHTLVITDAPNPTNNGTYIVTATDAGANTITWANPSGVASVSGGLPTATKGNILLRVDNFAASSNSQQVITFTGNPRISTGQFVTVKNALNPANNGRYLVTAVGTNTFTWANTSGVVPSTPPSITAVGGSLSLTITNFAASSNGTQVVTVTSNTGVSVGNSITIQNAPNPANNGTYLVTAVGTNTFTWANSSGAATLTGPVTGTNGTVTFTVTTFAPSSNGSQLLIVSSTSGISLGSNTSITITNAPNPANNGTYLLRYIIPGLNAIGLANPSGVASSSAPITAVGGSLSLTITNFAASSSGTQVLTVTSNTGVSVGNSITIQNSPILANNGTYLVSAVGTNTITWANSSGEASPTGVATASNGNFTVSVTNFAASSNGRQVVTVTSNSGIVVGDSVVVANAPNPTNNGTYIVNAITTDTITLANSSGVATSTTLPTGIATCAATGNATSASSQQNQIASAVPSSSTSDGIATFLNPIIGFSQPKDGKQRLFGKLQIACRVGDSITVTGSSYSTNNVTNAVILDIVGTMISISNSNGVYEYGTNATLTVSYPIYEITQYGGIDISRNLQQYVTGYNGEFKLQALETFRPFQYTSSIRKAYDDSYKKIEWDSFTNFTETQTVATLQKEINDFDTQIDGLRADDEFTEAFMNTKRDNDIDAIENAYLPAATTYLNSLDVNLTSKIPTAISLTITAFSALTTGILANVLERSSLSPSVLASTLPGEITPSNTNIIGSQQYSTTTYQTLTVNNIGTIEPYKNSITITGASNAANNVTNALVIDAVGNTIKIINPNGVAATSQTATGKYGDLVDFASNTWDNSATLESMVNTVTTNYNTFLTIKNSPLTAITTTKTITSFSTYSNTQVITVDSIGNILPRMTVRITGATNSRNNGVFKVLEVSGNTFVIETSRGVNATNSNAGSASYISFDYSIVTAENAITTINEIQESEAYITMIKGIQVYRKHYTNAINLVRRVGKNLGRWLRMKENALKEPYPIGFLSNGDGRSFIVSIPPTDTNYWTPRSFRGFTIVGEDTVRYPSIVNNSIFTVPPLQASTIKSYLPGQTYILNDHVSYNNNVYCCIKDNLVSTSSGIKGIIPLDTVNWEKVEYPNVENGFGSILEGSPDNFQEINAANYDLYTPILKYKTGSIVSSFYRGTIISFNASSNGTQKINLLSLDGIKSGNSITITNASNSANNGTFIIGSVSGAGLTITNFAASSNGSQILTVTSTSNIQVGDSLSIQNTSNPSNRGTYLVTSIPTDTTIQWANPSGVVSSSGAPTATNGTSTVTITNFGVSLPGTQVLTVSSTSGISVGNTITIKDAVNPGNNGTYLVTVIGTNTITWANPYGVSRSAFPAPIVPPTATNSITTISVISFAASSPSTQTLTVISASGISVGNNITVQNAFIPGNRGTYAVTAISENRITWANPNGVIDDVVNTNYSTGSLNNGTSNITVNNSLGVAESTNTNAKYIINDAAVWTCIRDLFKNKRIINIPPSNNSYYWIKKTYPTVIYKGEPVEANFANFQSLRQLNNTPRYDSTKSYGKGDTVKFSSIQIAVTSFAASSPGSQVVTVTSNSGIVYGDIITIEDASNSGNNGTYTVTAIDSTNTFTWANSLGVSSTSPVTAYIYKYYYLRTYNDKTYIQGKSPGTIFPSESLWVQIVDPNYTDNTTSNYIATSFYNNKSVVKFNNKYYRFAIPSDNIHIKNISPTDIFPSSVLFFWVQQQGLSEFQQSFIADYNNNTLYVNNNSVKYNNNYYTLNATTNYSIRGYAPGSTLSSDPGKWVEIPAPLSVPTYDSGNLAMQYTNGDVVKYNNNFYYFQGPIGFNIQGQPPGTTIASELAWIQITHPIVFVKSGTRGYFLECTSAAFPPLDGISLTITNFAASSNGLQVLTVTSTSDIRPGDMITIQNAPEITINGTYGIVSVGTNTVTWANPSGVSSLVNGRKDLGNNNYITIDITSFAASSNGTQVLTVTSTSGISVGNQIQIQNAPYPNNNGTYLVTDVGTNTITWANSLGLSSSVSAISSNYTKYPSYQSNSEYNPNDIVTYNGQLYQYIPSELYIVGVDVTNKVYWKQLRNQLVKYKNEWVEYSANLIPKLFPPDFKPYDASKIYFQNDIVSFVDNPGNIELYKCIDDSPRGFPITDKLPTSTEFWKRVTYPLTIIDGKMIEANPTDSAFKKLDELDFHEYENNWLYYKDDLVAYNGLVYQCTNVNRKNVTYPDSITGISPLTNSGYWEQVLSTDLNFINNTYYKANNIFPWNPVTNKKYGIGSIVLWKGNVYKSQQDISYKQIIDLNSSDDIAIIKSYIPSANELLWRKLETDLPKSIPKVYSNTETYPSYSEVMIHDFLDQEDIIISITSPFRIRIFKLIRLSRNEPQKYTYPELRVLAELSNDGFYKSGVIPGTYNKNNIPRYGIRSDDPFRLQHFASDLKRRVIHNVLFPYLHAKNNAKSIIEMLNIRTFNGPYVPPEYISMAFIEWSFPQAFNFKDDIIAPVFAEQSFNKLKETAQAFVDIFNYYESDSTPLGTIVTNFAASSGGRQVLTANTLGYNLVLGDTITVQNAYNSANNGTYILTNVTTTTITWLNPSGIAEPIPGSLDATIMSESVLLKRVKINSFAVSSNGSQIVTIANTTPLNITATQGSVTVRVSSFATTSQNGTQVVSVTGSTIGISVGQNITIANSPSSGNNGTYQVTAVFTNSFTWANPFGREITVTITRATNPNNNGTYRLNSLDATTFTWANPSGGSEIKESGSIIVRASFPRSKPLIKTSIRNVLGFVYYYLTKTLVDIRNNVIVNQTNKNDLKTRYYNSPFFQKMLADDPYPYFNVAALSMTPPVKCLRDLGVGDINIIEKLEKTGKIPQGSVDEYHSQKRKLDDFDGEVNIQLINLKSIISYMLIFHYKDGIIGADASMPIDYYYVDGYTYTRDTQESLTKLDEPSINVSFFILGPDDWDYKNMNSIFANSYLSEDDENTIIDSRPTYQSDGKTILAAAKNPYGITQLSYGAIVNSSLKSSLTPPEYTLPGSQGAQDLILLTYETKNPFVKGLGNFGKGLLGLCAATFQAADIASGLLGTIQFIGNWAVSGKPDGEVTADMPGGTEFINFSGNLSSLKFPEFNERAQSIRNVKEEVKAYRNRVKAAKVEGMTEEDDDALGDTLLSLGGLIIAYQTELDALEDVIRYEIQKETRIFQTFVPYPTLLDPAEPTKITYDVPKKPSKAELAYGNLREELEKLKIMYAEGIKRNEINTLTKLKNAAIDITNGQIKTTNKGIEDFNKTTQAQIDSLNKRIKDLQTELDGLGNNITKYAAEVSAQTTESTRAFSATRKPAAVLGKDVAYNRGGGAYTNFKYENNPVSYNGYKPAVKKTVIELKAEQPSVKNLADANNRKTELERLIREAKDELAKKALLTHIESQKKLGLLNDTDVAQIKRNIYEVIRKIQDIDNVNNQLNAELKQYRDDLHAAEVKQAQADEEYNKARADYEQQKVKVKNATDQFTRRIESTELEGKKFTFREKTVNKETLTIDYTFKKDVFTVKFLESETIYNIMRRNMPTAVLNQYSSIINSLSTNVTTPIGIAYKTIMTNLKTSVAAKNALLQYNRFKPAVIKASKITNLPKIANALKIGGGPLLEIVGIGVTAYSMGAFSEGETLFIDGMNEDVVNI